MLSHFGGGGGGGKEAASVKMKVCQNNNHWDTAGRGSYHCVLAFLCLHLTRYVTIIQTDRLFYNKVKRF